MVNVSGNSRIKLPILLTAINKDLFEIGVSQWIKDTFELRYFDQPLNQSDCMRVQVFCSNVFPIVDEKFCRNYPNLRFVLSPTTGITHIDSKFLNENLIKLISLKGRHDFLKEITSTAEFAWGLLLSVWRKIPEASNQESFKTESRSNYISRQLKGRDIGLIGYGRIGSKIAEYAHAFSMNVHFYDPYRDFNEKLITPNTIRHDSVNSLIKSCDIVIVCASVVDQDRKHYPLINDRNINLMRNESVLVNISRGIFVDELAIEHAMTEKKLFGVGLDVMSREELSSNRVEGNLYRLKKLGYNIVITPHIGGMSSDALKICIAEIVKDLELFWEKASG